MKRRIVGGLCVLAITLIALLGGITITHAGTYEEECDVVFLEALGQIISDEGITDGNIMIVKDPLYDLSLSQLGYVYSMTFNETEGFALIINSGGIFEVSELYLDAINPYDNYDGKKVYVSLMLYLVWQDNNFIETISGTTLDESMIEMLTESAFYSSSDGLTSGQEVIYYTNRTANVFELAKTHPSYIPVGLSNSCVPAAGGNIIGFYDRYYENLIPNFDPGMSLAQYYMYRQASAEVDTAITTLYYYMGTNATGAGTSIEGFRNGMTRYCNEKGRNISFNSSMQSGNFNYNITKQRLESGLPLVLFVDTFKVVTLSNSTGSETISHILSSACHAMAGFGYNEVTYTLTNGQVRTDRYIAVATGLVSFAKGFLNINSTQIDECYAVTIS